MKIYVKRGSFNYKERKYVEEITKALSEKGVSMDNFQPATNFNDLYTLYQRYCVQDAEILDESEEKIEPKMKEEKAPIQTEEKISPDSKFVDPFNDGEVIVRDYVMDDGGKSDSEPSSNFDEPKNSKEAFEFPNENFDSKQPKQNNNKKESSQNQNSSFVSDTSSSAKKKSTKRLAKGIVHATCKLAEFGYCWWITKDITPDKIAEYDAKKSMDLDILLSLDEGQQIKVRDWFSLQVQNANDLIKVSEEGKEEMTEALYNVLLEKGVQLTPTQEALMTFGVHLLIDLGTKAWAMQQSIKGVLNQLIAMQKEQGVRDLEAEMNESANTNTFTEQSFEEEIKATEEESVSSTQLATI